MKMFFMPVYINEWFGSAIVRRMSFAAKGIYEELLKTQWVEGHIGQTEADAREILRCTDEEWAQFAKFFDETFPVDEDGYRRNPQNARIKAEQVAYMERQTQNGKKGGRPAKSGSTKPTQNPNETQPITQTKPTQNPDHNPNETQTKPLQTLNFKLQTINSKLETSPAGEGVQGEDHLEVGLELGAGGKTDFEEFWAEFQSLYPKRAGGYDKKPARAKLMALIRGKPALKDEILAGLRRYRAYCDATGKTGTDLVRMYSTWVSKDSWTEDWAAREASKPQGVTGMTLDALEIIKQREAARTARQQQEAQA